MQDYFRSRTEIYRASGAAFVPHLERFYLANYKPFDPQELASNSEAETVLAVTASDGVTEVITSGFTGGRHRSRYRLISLGDSWLISSAELECFSCHGSGKRKDGQKTCNLCDGKGWH